MPQKKDTDKRVFTGVYFDRPQHDALRALSDRPRVPLAAYLREAVDMLLAKFGVKTAPPRAKKKRSGFGAPNTWAQYTPVALDATATPICVKSASMMFEQWRGLSSHSATTCSGVDWPVATFSPTVRHA